MDIILALPTIREGKRDLGDYFLLNAISFWINRVPGKIMPIWRHAYVFDAVNLFKTQFIS